jgi:segregation and condensation protein B
LESNQAANSSPNREKAEKTTDPSVATLAQPVEPQQSKNQHNIDAEEKKQHNLVLLEAALYVAGRPLDVNEMCSVLNTRSKKKAEQLVEALRAEYASRNTAMEILRLKDERYVMQVKADFTPLVRRLVNRPLLSSGPLKTLSYIAYRQPITSKRVIEVRGQHAYGHVKVLKEMGLVATERSGRSIVLKTTDYFADYFGLTMDTTTMKRDLKRIFGEALKDEPQP